MVLFALIAVWGGGSMPSANYPAQSDLPDKAAIGGYGVSDNKSWSNFDVAVKPKGFELIIKKNVCCGTKGGDCPLILILSNGTKEPVWIRAEDSRLPLVREAVDSTGAWKPVEYRIPSDCGNSYHSVALAAGRSWVWDIPSTSGSMATKSRYVLRGLKEPLFSAEFECKLDPSVFDLPDSLSKFGIRADGVVPAGG